MIKKLRRYNRVWLNKPSDWSSGTAASYHLAFDAYGDKKPKAGKYPYVSGRLQINDCSSVINLEADGADDIPKFKKLAALCLEIVNELEKYAGDK